jgi:hypothetical protein
MFRRWQIFLVVVLNLSFVQTGVSGGPAPNESSLKLGMRLSSPEPLALPAVTKLSKLQQAYLDSYNILSHDNACTKFFGGPGVIFALNALTTQARTTYDDRNITVAMHGEITNYRDASGFSYRLFQRAEINMLGAFYQDSRMSNRGTISSIGQFLPNTREARVAVLLHEVGHLVRGPNDRWLLPDDGNNPGISHDNTQRVIAVCGEQIRSLQNITFEAELAALKSSAGTEEFVASKD